VALDRGPRRPEAGDSEILGAGPEFDARFYQTEAFVGGFASQGDIVQLTSAAPCIDAAGSAIVTDATFDHWMVVGNTCDMHRDDEPRSLIAPLVGLAEPVPDEQRHTLRRYEYSRQFYVPSWPNRPAPRDDAGGRARSPPESGLVRLILS
jgi:hypothetical protein